MEAILKVPDARDDQRVADWCAAVRHNAQAAATKDAAGFNPWRDDQRKRLQRLFHTYTQDRDERLAMSNWIFEASGLTGQALTTLNELSEAQATGLIRACFGPDPDSIELLPSAHVNLGLLRDRVRWKRLGTGQ